MKESTKTLEFKFERTIPAPPEDVFDAWLNPKIPGNPWNAAEKFILSPKVDGLFYWTFKGTAHYGRFTEFDRPGLRKLIDDLKARRFREATAKNTRR